MVIVIVIVFIEIEQTIVAIQCKEDVDCLLNFSYRIIFVFYLVILYYH